ncbi:hypothetical protein [Bosea sp. LjRoot9]
MRTAEKAPQIGALLAVALTLMAVIALVCAPVILQLLLLAGAGR